MFVAAHGDRALAGLRDLVFQHDEIDALGIDVAQTQFSGEDRAHQFRPISSRLARAARAAPRSTSGPVRRLVRYGAHFEVNMVFIVHRDFENHHIGPLDHRIDHLAVDKIDVGHAKEKSQVLAVGIFDIAPDAPFDSSTEMIGSPSTTWSSHRVPMAPVHEAHMSVV